MLEEDVIKMRTHLVLAVEESTELALYDYPCCDPSYGSVCVAGPCYQCRYHAPSE